MAAYVAPAKMQNKSRDPVGAAMGNLEPAQDILHSFTPGKTNQRHNIRLRKLEVLAQID